MSTLALDGSSGRASEGGRALAAVRYADLGLLALALPVFLVAGWPLLGYGVAATAWLVQRAVQKVTDGIALRKLAEGNRRHALGIIAGATLGRLWIVTLSILLVGGLADREDGLAAAVLSAALVTIYLAGLALARLVTGEEVR